MIYEKWKYFPQNEADRIRKKTETEEFADFLYFFYQFQQRLMCLKVF